MLKCILIYLWIYIGLFYIIEAGDDNEHVHIKLHMTSGQRKRAQIQLHSQHHKKRSPPPSASHHHHHSHPQPPPPPPPPPPSSSSATNLYHESPHNYLTGITSTSSTSSLEPQQHIFSRTKKYPSSALLQLQENGQLLNIDEDVYGQGDIGGGSFILSSDTDVGEHTIPSYLTKNFALFPQPTTTYETEIIPNNSEGFNVVKQGVYDGLDNLEEEEENEISKYTGKGAAGSIESIILAEQQMENYQRHKPSTYSSASQSSSSRIIKNEQLLQQLLKQQQQQQHNNEEAEIMNAAAYKSTKLRGNKYRAEKDYHSEDDMTEALMYSTKHNPTHNFKRDEEQVSYRGGIKPLTVDDIWSQLQQQYLNKYSPQAQTLTAVESGEQPLSITTTIKTKPKHKRNTKRQRHAKPTITSYPSSWPVKTLSFGSSSSNKHHKHQLKQPQFHYNDEILSLPSAAAFSSGRLSSHRDTDLFAKRPFNKFTAHDDDEDDEDDNVEIDEDTNSAVYGEDNVDDDDDDDDVAVDVYGHNADNNHDESFEEAVYQRGKKFTGHTAHGQHSHTNNPFNYHDLYGSYSTPITATVATHIQPSTYHPNLVSSTLPSYTGTSSTSSLLSALSQHPSTSYQWRTQQNYPASYQTYHLQHQQQQQQQQQQPEWSAAAAASAEGVRGGGEQYAQHHQHLAKQQSNAALRLPKATITQTPNTSSSSSSKLSPTQSNDFTVSTSSLSSSSSAKSTVQPPPPPPARYKKRKNRIKTKRNRIVVI